MPRGVHIARQRNRRVLDFVGYQTISDARDLLAGDCQAHAEPEAEPADIEADQGHGLVLRIRATRSFAGRGVSEHRTAPNASIRSKIVRPRIDDCNASNARLLA